LIPVEVLPLPVAASADAETSPSTPRRRKSRGGIIEIELGGERRIRVDSDVDTEALRRVLDALVNR
jgi:transposase